MTHRGHYCQFLKKQSNNQSNILSARRTARAKPCSRVSGCSIKYSQLFQSSSLSTNLGLDSVCQSTTNRQLSPRMFLQVLTIFKGTTPSHLDFHCHLISESPLVVDTIFLIFELGQILGNMARELTPSFSEVLNMKQPNSSLPDWVLTYNLYQFPYLLMQAIQGPPANPLVKTYLPNTCLDTLIKTSSLSLSLSLQIDEEIMDDSFSRTSFNLNPSGRTSSPIVGLSTRGSN